MMEFSDSELEYSVILLEEEENVLLQPQKTLCERKRRRYSVHPMWQTRETEGDFVLFKKLLMDHEDKFYEYFCMSRNCFTSLFQKIECQLVKKLTNWKSPITPQERLAVCLRYLTTGDSLKTISYSFRMGRATVSGIVQETCKVISKTLLSETMPMPSTEKWEEIKQTFWEKYKFPNCMGAIEGKHINIQVSPKSIELLALVDANSNFIAVEIGAYDKNNGKGLLAQSQLGQELSDGSFRMLPDTNLPGTSICAPCVILGDEAFPLKRNILKPYTINHAKENEDQKYFNTQLTITRRVVDDAFGKLAQKFKIYSRQVLAKPENAAFIFMATCVLYNFIRLHEKSHGTYQLHDLPQETEMQNATWLSFCPQGGNATRESFRIREQFKDYIFASRLSHTSAT